MTARKRTERPAGKQRPGRRPGARPVELPDEQAPEVGGGVFRALGAGTGGSAGMLGLIEQLFAPNAYDAKQVLQEQKNMGETAPTPTDPPDLRPEPGTDPAHRFRATIRLPRPSN